MVEKSTSVLSYDGDRSILLAKVIAKIDEKIRENQGSEGHIIALTDVLVDESEKLNAFRVQELNWLFKKIVSQYFDVGGWKKVVIFHYVLSRNNDIDVMILISSNLSFSMVKEQNTNTLAALEYKAPIKWWLILTIIGTVLFTVGLIVGFKKLFFICVAALAIVLVFITLIAQ